MPIKFRCEHCRQLLGISRTKAGQVADCPTCGRSVRVPELDGRRDPVPPPELDLDDSQLASALDELAQIGLEPDEAAPAAAEPDQTPQKAEIITPEPLAEPVPIAPPPAAEPKEVQASVSQPARKPATDSLATNAALAELARGDGLPSPVDSLPRVSKRRRWATLLSLPVAGLLLGTAVVGLGTGYFVGHGRNAESGPSAKGNGSEPRVDGEATTKPAITGRITWKNEEGDSRPDRLARVLLFPQQRAGQRKLDVIGLRNGDSTADFRSAAAAFRALGGNVTLVGEKGGFEISLPAAGTYQILVISKYQPRDTNEAIAAPLLNLLSQYFDRPEQLLGRAAYHSAQIRYKGAEPVLWVHSF